MFLSICDLRLDAVVSIALTFVLSIFNDDETEPWVANLELLGLYIGWLQVIAGG